MRATIAVSRFIAPMLVGRYPEKKPVRVLGQRHPARILRSTARRPIFIGGPALARGTAKEPAGIQLIAGGFENLGVPERHGPRRSLEDPIDALFRTLLAQADGDSSLCPPGCRLVGHPSMPRQPSTCFRTSKTSIFMPRRVPLGA